MSWSRASKAVFECQSWASRVQRSQAGLNLGEHAADWGRSFVLRLQGGHAALALSLAWATARRMRLAAERSERRLPNADDAL
jgi:hypothetical protein